MSGQVKVVQYLLSLRSELALVMNDDGYIALHLAASHGKLNVVQFLLENHPEDIPGLTSGQQVKVDTGNRLAQVIVDLAQAQLKATSREIRPILGQARAHPDRALFGCWM